MVKVAAVQMASGPNVQANLMEASRWIKEAANQGADFITLPETFAMMGVNDSDRVHVAETYGGGPIQDTISRLAAQLKVWVLAGTVPIRSDDPKKAYAASLLFNDQGDCVARYDKIHLFDVTVENGKKEVYIESDTTAHGQQPVVVETPFGRVGMSICYDVRFPELYRKLSAEGAQIITVPAAFTKVTGEAHWDVLLRARAIENLCYLIAPAQGGYHVNGRATYGHSVIIDYWGRVQATLDKGTGVVVSELDLGALERVRKSFPVLSHRCPHGVIYGQNQG